MKVKTGPSLKRALVRWMPLVPILLLAYWIFEYVGYVDVHSHPPKNVLELISAGCDRYPFKVREDALTIINETLPGHVLHPGYVERRVVDVDGVVYIQTRGVGTGALGYLNVAGANVLWHSVDAQIARELRGIYPQTVIVP